MEFSNELYMIGRTLQPNESLLAKSLTRKAMIKVVDMHIKCTIKPNHSVEERQTRIKQIYFSWETALLKLSKDGIDNVTTSDLDGFIDRKYPQLFSLSRS
jgi:hypothetical protein